MKRDIFIKSPLPNDPQPNVISAKLDGLEKQISLLGSAISLLSSTMTRGFQNIEKRFEGVDGRFKGIDQHLNDIDRRLDGIDDRLDRIETTVTEHTGQIDGLYRHIDGFVGFVKRFDAEIAALSHRMARHGLT